MKSQHRFSIVKNKKKGELEAVTSNHFLPKRLDFPSLCRPESCLDLISVQFFQRPHCGCWEGDLVCAVLCWIMLSITVPERMSPWCFPSEKWGSFKESSWIPIKFRSKIVLFLSWPKRLNYTINCLFQFQFQDLILTY